MSSVKSKAIKQANAAIEASVDTGVMETSDETSGKSPDATFQVSNEDVEKAAKGPDSSQAKLTEILEKTVKNSEEILAFSKGNLEAIIESTGIYASGFQDISKELAVSGKASFDESVAFTKSLISVKSGKEAFELQTSFIKASIESAVAERKKVVNAITKLAEQTFAPLSTRFTLAIEVLGKTH
jgi:phasin family protein